jgi:addiction module HigA family antidote
MSNYVEFNDKIAFHPGYYIKEIIDDSGLTQEDFAKRLDTTPKNLSYLVRGEQNLSVDIAMKLSRMLGTSINYWLNLQQTYDTLIAEMNYQEEIEKEREVFREIDYSYFRKNFGLPNLPRKTDEQIECLRKFLQVASLTVFKKKDMAVSFRNCGENMNDSNIIKANIMVQIAINKARKVDAPQYNRNKFKDAAEYALSLTTKHAEFYPILREEFRETGVIFVVLPNLPGSKTSGATKKIGDNILLMVNDRRMYSDSFWFTLFHEIGHIMNGDYGITFEKETCEDDADKYAEDKLIPPEAYQEFIRSERINADSIRRFANLIERDPGIILGRLKKDGKVTYDNKELTMEFSHKYKVKYYEK